MANHAITNAVNADPDARHHSFALLSCRPFMENVCAANPVEHYKDEWIGLPQANRPDF